MKRIVMVLCVVALIFGVANLAVFAKEAAAATNSTENYDSLQAAVNDYTSGVIVMEADAQDLTVDRDVYLDLNGHTVENVNVTGGTLYCMDSETDDYSVEDGVYGKLTGTITGNVAGVPQEAACAEHGYLKVTEADGISFHCVNLKIYAMSLRATEVGVYYKSYFAGDELVAQNVLNFGVALSVVAEPNGANLERYCGYSVFTKFLAGKDANSAKATGTLLRDIMKTANTDRVNTRNSGMPVYGRAYIKTADGYMFGATVNRNLKQQVEAVNDKWDELSSTQKASVTAMYRDYKVVMHDTWDIPNIIYAEKFEEAITAQDSYVTGSTVTIGELFAATEVGKAEETKIVSESVQVVVAPAGPEDDARGIYEANITDWTKGTLQMFGLGTAKITITDNCYCKPMTIEVAIIDPQPEDKFTANSIETQITGSAVTMGQLFVPIQGVDIDAENIVVTVGTQTVANGPAWADALYTFETAGEYVFAITDNDYCIPASVTVTVEDPKPVDKFAPASAINAYAGQPIALGDLFGAIDGVSINSATVTVTIFGGTYTKNEADWKQSTLVFDAAGTYTVEITDNELCNTATNTVAINLIDAFEIAFKDANKYLFRVGNQSEFNISKLFNLADVSKYNLGAIGITFKNKQTGETLHVAEVNQNTFAAAKTAFEKTFTGIVEVTISSKYANAVTLNLEVVNAVNATSATSATENNVVLLNDISGGFTVSGRYTVYGNGFTCTYTGDGRYLNNGLKQGVITVSENGTLDNLRIIASIYPTAYMYYGTNSLGEAVQDGPKEVDGTKTRYYYQLSAVAAKDNATISNCYIYGGRNNIFINTGDVTVKDTILECGTLANVQIQSNNSHTVTLENVTTIQHQTNPTIGDTAKVMLGAGVLVGPETASNPKIVINGSLKQYNWVNEDDAVAVNNTTAKSIVKGALNAKAYNHQINGKTASNLGVIYLNQHSAVVEDVPGSSYKLNTISIEPEGFGGNSITGQVYSPQNAPVEQIYYDVENANRTTVNGLYQPQFKYTEDLGGQHIPKTDESDEYCYREGNTIHVMFPSGDTRVIDLAGLVDIQKYSGEALQVMITCKDSNGTLVLLSDDKLTLSAAEDYAVAYTVTDTRFYDQNGNAVEKDPVTYVFNVTLSVSLKDSAVPDARFAFVSDNQKMGYYKPAWGDVKQYLPFLAGLQIYDYNGQTEYLRFDGDSKENGFDKVASVTITGYTSNEAYIEVKLIDGGVINTKFLARADSGGGSTYTGKIKTSGTTIYFVTDSGTSNKDTTTTKAYWYVDYYKFTGNNGVAIQSAQQTFNSTGSSQSTPSGNFNTTINYTVTYEANGGNCGQTTGYATSVSSAVTLPASTRSGYIFAGWYTAVSGGNKVGGAGEKYTPTANITLYARWGKPCTVTYNANGGSCGIASERYTGPALTLPTATRDGYWFIGWYDAAVGGNKIGDAGADYTPDNESTLYAQWQERVEYTVTYHANGGTCSTVSATYEGAALVLPTPTRTGYKCNGWYTAASGGTKIGNAGASYTPTASVTLYAQWSGCVVTYNANGGSCATTSQTYAGTALTLPTPTRDGYTFDGWSDGSKTYQAGASYTPAADVTLTAKWTENSGGGCVASGTLITLANGAQIPVQDLTGTEQLLVWNLETGAYDSAPIVFVDSDAETEYEIVHLYFSDGTDVEVIYEHGFFDTTLGEYVYLDRNNAADHIGHSFVKQGDIAEGTWETVQLTDVVIENKVTTAYSPVTFSHLCYYVDGMLSMPGGIEGLFNIFQVDTDIMAYDAEKKAADIESYGLFTYEDFADVIPEEAFYAFNGAYLKVAIGKGMLTWEDIEYLAQRYVPLM